MSKIKFLLSSSITLALLAAAPVLIFAQSNSLPTQTPIPPPPKNIPLESAEQDFNFDPLPDPSDQDFEGTSTPLYPGTVECFDHYHFQSVQVSAAAEKETYNAGEEILFKGEVTNENDYPVVDGYVFVRVGPVNSKYRKEGHHITDEFFAAERMALDAGVTTPIEFKWRVPQGAAQGEYIANYFFSVGKRFNLGGLPFSNEVVVGATRFEMKNEKQGGILFDRSGTLVNGKRYAHIGNWPDINPGEPVTILQPIKNSSKLEKEIKVAYELYYWDSLRAEDKVAESEETVKLAPGAAKTLRYEIPKMDTSVYYLKIRAVTDNDSAIVNIRVASDQARPRINYPAITKFPIVSRESFTVFSCFHNTSGADAEGNVSVVLSDRRGNKVGEASYVGVIPSSMLAVAADIIATKSYDYLSLHAEIRNAAGEIADSYDTVYACDELKSPACDSLAQKRSKQNFIIIGLVAILVLIFIGYRILHADKNNPKMS